MDAEASTLKPHLDNLRWVSAKFQEDAAFRTNVSVLNYITPIGAEGTQ